MSTESGGASSPVEGGVDYKTLFLGSCTLVVIFGGGFYGIWSRGAEQAAEAIRIARDQLRALDANLDFSAAQIRALNGLMAGLKIGYQEPVPSGLAGGGLEGVAAYAAGGYAKPGWALVGEQGPEIVRFERPAQVLTATQTRQALSGDDGKAVRALEDIKAELRAIVTTQSGANPQIIERLASIEGRLNAMEREQKVVNGNPQRRRAPA